VLNPESFRHYIQAFNRNDAERTVNYIDDKSSWEWLRNNIPFFEASGKSNCYPVTWW